VSFQYSSSYFLELTGFPLKQYISPEYIQTEDIYITRIKNFPRITWIRTMTMKSKKKHLRSLLRIYILGIIIKNEKVHGYSIYKELLERIDESIYKKTGTPSIGTIYRILKELVEEGLVTKEERTKNGRKIIYYAPTKKGIEEFLSISKMFITKVIMGLSLVIDVVKTLDKKGYDIVDIFYDIKKINQITSNI